MAHDLDAKHWLLNTHARFDRLMLEPCLMLEPIKSKNIELEQPMAHDLDAINWFLGTDQNQNIELE